jgi:hypothetical protein
MGSFTWSEQMKKKVYTFRKGSQYPQEKALVVGAELDKISKQYGKLQPDLVVSHAKPKTSILHEFFEWDDSTAASKYRLRQASELIRSVKVVYEDNGPDGETKQIRAFMHVDLSDDEAETCYVSAERAMRDPDLREQVLQRALKEAREWQERYRELAELADVFKAIDMAAKSLEVQLHGAARRRA